MLMRLDPFQDVERWMRQSPAMQRAGIMPMDAYRHGDHYVMHFDVPGVEAGSIELTVDKDMLTVSAQRSWEPSDGDEPLVSERFQGKYTRRVVLGDALDLDSVEAHYDKGVLTVTIPVAESAKPRKVQITSAAGGERREAITSGSRGS